MTIRCKLDIFLPSSSSRECSLEIPAAMDLRYLSHLYIDESVGSPLTEIVTVCEDGKGDLNIPISVSRSVQAFMR